MIFSRRRVFKIFTFIQVYSVILTVLAILYLNELHNSESENLSKKTLRVVRHINTTKGIKREIKLKKKLDHDNWMHIGGQVHIYSAFLDKRDEILMGATVKVLSIMPESAVHRGGLRCMLWYVKRKEAVQVDADVTFFNEQHEKAIKATFISCSPPANLNKEDVWPYAVSIQLLSLRSREAVGVPNPVKIRNMPKRKGMAKLAICTRPNNNVLNDTLKIAEFIAFYSIVGVSKFMIYHTGLTSDVQEFIGHVQDLGVEIDLVPWNLNKQHSEDVFENARVISINDCLYRNMNRFEYLTMVDMNEYIAPMRSDIKLVKLLNYTERLHTSPSSVFYFAKKVYCKNEQTFENSSNLNLMTQRFRKLQKRTNHGRPKVKYVIRPHLVNEVGTHQVMPTSGSQILMVKPQLGFLHQYKLCSHEMLNKSSIEHTYMTNFHEKLLNSSILTTWINKFT